LTLAVVVVWSVAGCSLVIDTDDLANGDGGVDVDVDAAGDCDWHAANFSPCELPIEASTQLRLTNGNYIYDTDTGTLEDPSGTEVPHSSELLPWAPQVRLVRVGGFELQEMAELDVYGSYPLVIVSESVIVIAGDMDLGAGTGGRVNAGADSSLCGDTQKNGNMSNGGGSGGAGGSFGGNGGNGGVGDGDASMVPGGIRADKVVGVPLTPRGGCGGGDGGDGASSQGGDGSSSGGALQLSARDSLSVLETGKLDARGGGGAGAPAGSGGGGGGGSGGYILLDSPTISIHRDARVAATGGGGGGGAAGGAAGGDGQSGNSDGSVALGGGSPAGATDGGNGSAPGTVDGSTPSASSMSGGGGGGGAAGFILYHATDFFLQGVRGPEPLAYPE
jgi:hypothetical protein